MDRFFGSFEIRQQRKLTTTELYLPLYFPEFPFEFQQGVL